MANEKLILLVVVSSSITTPALGSKYMLSANAKAYPRWIPPRKEVPKPVITPALTSIGAIPPI